MTHFICDIITMDFRKSRWNPPFKNLAANPRAAVLERSSVGGRAAGLYSVSKTIASQRYQMRKSIRMTVMYWFLKTRRTIHGRIHCRKSENWKHPEKISSKDTDSLTITLKHSGTRPGQSRQDRMIRMAGKTQWLSLRTQRIAIWLQKETKTR